MNGILLDTHTWLWAQLGIPGALSRDSIREIEESQQQRRAFVCGYSVLEISRMVHFGGYDLGTSLETFLVETEQDYGLRITPVNSQVLIASTRLPGDMHRDPADRIIVATAREHGLTLYTHEKAILRYATAGHLSARKV